jgi:hypothetical protein
MTDRRDPNACPDCLGEGRSRRDFVRTVGGAAVAGLFPLAAGPRPAHARQQDAAGQAAETAVQRLHKSLSPEQKRAICFPFDHPLRSRINANWAITEPKIEDDFTAEQQALIREVFRGVTSPEGYERFLKQMDDDAGGFGQYHVAIFGEPGSGRFEFEMTGRHLTIRADGDSVEGAAFGGPIIYGHGAGDSEKGLPGNVFYYQTRKANEVFQALDGAQRAKALLAKAPPEAQVPVQGDSGRFPGIRLDELAPDQRVLVESVIKIILDPYREADVEEAMALMKAGGGLDALHMAFFESDDLGGDQEWDIWRLEGPTFVWHFRGAPHVHAYVNVAKRS